VIDTTNLSVHELRRDVITQFGPASGGAPRMVTRFVSFGFKYGPPVDADVVLDVRFLENPYFVRELKELPGTDARVERFVLEKDETVEFLAKAKDLLLFTLPRCEREGKSYLTVAIGCTGGRHRSVVVTTALAEALTRELNVRIVVLHRDVGRGDHARAEQVLTVTPSQTAGEACADVTPEATGPSSDGQTTAHELAGATSAPPPRGLSGQAQRGER
jgi:UPF0042 nucleotide-binding protein